mmetsp:Transcript_28190/g.86146  ORF Transcript_28190/g.86146 Transcript_28190/m.86146 type:complete len:369 (+) Transcript_28190:44-1150(+)
MISRLPLPLLLIVWYVSSAVTSISTKEILVSFPFPIAVAAIQQLVSASFGSVGTSSSAAFSSLTLASFKHNFASIAPVAMTMVVSLVAYRWSLLYATVSFTCIIKTLAPLFTMIFSYFIASEPTSYSRCASVVPIVIGVALTSATEVEFSVPGALAALAATASQALQIVLTKRLMTAGGWSKADLFYHVAISGFLTLCVLVLVFESRDLYDSYLSSETTGLRSAALLWMLVNGLCSFCNQYACLSVLDRFSTPLSHALANVMKRAFVVIIAMAHAQMPVTPLHLCGAILSIFGALIYQQAVRCSTRDSKDGYSPVPLDEVSGCIDGFKRASGFGEPVACNAAVIGGRQTAVELEALNQKGVVQAIDAV